MQRKQSIDSSEKTAAQKKAINRQQCRESSTEHQSTDNSAKKVAQNISQPTAVQRKQQRESNKSTAVQRM